MPVVPPGKSNKGRRFSHEEWDAMYHCWKSGERNKTRLAAKFHCSEDTVHKFVLKGLPVNNWPSFLDRLRLEQNVSEQTQAKIADSIAKDITDAYGKVKEESLVILRQFRLVCTHQVVKLQKTLETMPMTRQAVHYSVNDKGEPVRKTVERPLDAVETAGVARALSGAITAANKMESLWLGGPTERIENIPESEKLSQADLDYINTHEGELPPGMTIEQLIAKMGRAYGVPIGGPGQGN
jgi:hypothetical protein